MPYSGFPNKPQGLMISTTAIAIKLNAIAIFGRNIIPIELANPKRIAPKKAPPVLPNPPITIIIKHSIVTVPSIPKKTEAIGAINVPPSPASQLANMNTTV